MNLTRRGFSNTLAASAATAANAGGIALAGCAGTAPGTPHGPTLDSLARAKGLRFGSALGSLGRPSRFHDAAYRELTGRECSVLVAENETKWPQLRPDPTQPYDFRAADEMFAWARGRGMAVRGHTLLWLEPKWLPRWVNEAAFGATQRSAAETLLAEHVRSVCRHFGDSIESWDVVNEAVDPASGELRRNVFSTPIGSFEQIDLAFRLAREHAPRAQLVYNDYMDWGAANARHRAAVLKLLAALKQRDAPVQALGVQAHIGVWGPRVHDGGAQAREWRRFLDEVMAMDLDILITEFDVNDRTAPAAIAERDAAVAAVARDWLDTTLAVPRLNRFLCWGLADHYSWLQGLRPRDDQLPRRPLPYDAQLQPKPLRAAIADALRAMPARAAR